MIVGNNQNDDKTQWKYNDLMVKLSIPIAKSRVFINKSRTQSMRYEYMYSQLSTKYHKKLHFWSENQSIFKSYNDAQETVNGAFSLCGWSMKQHN